MDIRRKTIVIENNQYWIMWDRVSLCRTSQNSKRIRDVVMFDSRVTARQLTLYLIISKPSKTFLFARQGSMKVSLVRQLVELYRRLFESHRRSARLVESHQEEGKAR